jgi:hypothetical protein
VEHGVNVGPSRFDDIAAKARCPRCGHPQRGVIASDASSWPLVSECSECGLRIEWAEYFRSEFDLPRWWIEHASGWRLLVTIPMTMLASVVGWPLWFRLRMAHPIRVRRLSMAIAFLVLVVVPVSALVELCARAASNMGPFRWTGAGPPDFVVHTTAGPFFYRGTVEQPGILDWLQTFSRIVVAPTSSVPLEVVGRVHLEEPSGSTGLRRSFIEVNNAQQPANATGPNSVPKTWRMPLLTGRGFGLGSPAELWAHWLRSKRYGLLFAGLALATSLATFALLPIARRRAKVRWDQIARAGVYATLGPCAAIAAVALAKGSVRLHPPMQNSILGSYPSVVAGTFAILFLWWGIAAGRYLRMERPWAVAASIASISTLVALSTILIEL